MDVPYGDRSISRGVEELGLLMDYDYLHVTNFRNARLRLVAVSLPCESYNL
jgi:hypothetical protein